MAKKPRKKLSHNKKAKSLRAANLEAYRETLESYRMPWEQMPGETSMAFAAFQIYRDLGGERNMPDAAKEMGRSIKSIYVWSSKYNWRKRVSAWDAHLDRQAQKEAARKAREMRDRHARAGLLLIKKAISRIELIEPKKMQDAIAIKMIEVGAKLEARARGEPEEIQQHDHTVDARPIQAFIIGGKKIEF